jgi:hypothetical protein
MEIDELHKAFLSDLSALLKKYNAEMNYQIEDKGWFSNQVMMVDFNGIYEGDNQRGYSQLQLPSWID